MGTLQPGMAGGGTWLAVWLHNIATMLSFVRALLLTGASTLIIVSLARHLTRWENSQCSLLLPLWCWWSFGKAVNRGWHDSGHGPRNFSSRQSILQSLSLTLSLPHELHHASSCVLILALQPNKLLWCIWYYLRHLPQAIVGACTLMSKGANVTCLDGLAIDGTLCVPASAYAWASTRRLQ